MLTTLTMPLALPGSFEYIKKQERAFYGLMLLLETGVVGVFASLDLFLFYVFFELTLVPMYFIVGKMRVNKLVRNVRSNSDSST